MYVIQVGYETKEGNWDWRDVSPHHGDPYTFTTEEEAIQFRDWLDEQFVYDKELRVVYINE